MKLIFHSMRTYSLSVLFAIFIKLGGTDSELAIPYILAHLLDEIVPQQNIGLVLIWGIVSSSGDWSGNICDFYFRVYNRIAQDIKVPFKLEGTDRIDDTPMHKALREALANALIQKRIK